MFFPIPESFLTALAESSHWFNCGLEREGLRATNKGKIATTFHPAELGAKLTHPHITTDFGEAQLELITSPHPTTNAALAELEQLHAWVWSKLDANQEVLWPNSMPCGLPQSEDAIAIANYGVSNAAELKHIYRLGLTYRYGSAMQTVSGVHLNLSLADQLLALLAQQDGGANDQAFRNRIYFALMRNYRRFSFVINYLLGASTIIDASMARLSHTIQRQDFDPIGPTMQDISPDNQALVGIGATTLRQSDVGYVAPQQRGMGMCFNHLDSYIQGVNANITSSHPQFASIGITDSQGNYRQLGAGLLQIENEYYTAVRPKHPTSKGQRPLLALAENGVEYLELRNLDINPLAPCGIDQTGLDFMSLMFLWCAALPSREFTYADCQQVENNELVSATRGRAPDTSIQLGQDNMLMIAAVERVLEQLALFANQLDRLGHGQYAQALDSLRRAGPLSQALEDACRKQHYRNFCIAQAGQNRAALAPLSAESRQRFNAQTKQSWEEVAEIEAAHATNPVPFATFFTAYMQGL